MFFIHRLTHVTHGAVMQRAGPINIIGKRGYEDCRNRVARVEKAPEEFETRHGRHMDVGDQAGCFGKPRRREKFCCRREGVDRMAERSHEPAHGLAKEPIVIDDRNQYLLHHAALAIRWTRRAGCITMP
jgi:hypothetical protein